MATPGTATTIAETAWEMHRLSKTFPTISFSRHVGSPFFAAAFRR
ncbi:hypothetical protein AB0F52_30145 [Amycolatopsis sp. NPDC024027]